eukprot:EG_transcript_4102
MAPAARRASADPDAISVAARFCPVPDGPRCIATVADRHVEWTNPDGAVQKFDFDHVFRETVAQEEVFDTVGRRIVADVLEGYNGTIFAYGQTGSGKTHTMLGPLGVSDGVIPQAADLLFKAAKDSPSDTEFTFRVSYVEIYMERIRDLLDPTKVNLALHEDYKNGLGVFVGDATELYVTSVTHILEVLALGARHRAEASTKMNARSSRSHAVLSIVVSQRRAKELKTGKLCLVDLAGSERAGKTGASGQQLEEAKLINRSLTTLGIVINALTESGRTHVPYRDSKLTRLLQDSVGGNSRSALIICCSPDPRHAAETLSTLQFGQRAKQVRNQAKVNREWTLDELKARLAHYERENARLRKLLNLGEESEAAAPKHSEEEWLELNAQVEQMMVEIEHLRDDGERKAAQIASLEQQLRDAAQSLVALPEFLVESVDASTSSSDEGTPKPEEEDEVASFVGPSEQEAELLQQLQVAEEELKARDARLTALTAEARESGRALTHELEQCRLELAEQLAVVERLQRRRGLLQGLVHGVGRRMSRLLQVVTGGRAPAAESPATPRAPAFQSPPTPRVPPLRLPTQTPATPRVPPLHLPGTPRAPAAPAASAAATPRGWPFLAPATPHMPAFQSPTPTPRRPAGPTPRK